MQRAYDIKLLPPSFSPWRPQQPPEKQIAVLMSGGVDSSIAALLLKQAGWEVLGVTMKIPFSYDNAPRGCCGADAALVCHELGLPHYYVGTSQAFRELIIDRFQRTYSQGQTPNPCADCNTFLKFSLVWDFLQEELNIGHLATGHYARITRKDDQVRLSRAKDHQKDQSYFLYGISADRLSRLHLPLCELTKKEVRSIVLQTGLSIADKPESMELCFADEGDYRKALHSDQKGQPGTLTDMQGNPIGTHQGVARYTLGQRRGLGYAAGMPLYVGRIDAGSNAIALATRDEISSCYVKANEMNVLMPDQIYIGKRLFGKIRSYGDPKPCIVNTIEGDSIEVIFDHPQFAPCPGQKLVLYDAEDNIVAGGTIVEF